MGSKLIVVLLLLQALLSGPNIVHSTPEFSPSQDLSWSDDFEDGNFDDWVIMTIEGESLVENFTIIDGVLFAQDEAWNYAFHDSEVVTGTWSLDVYAVEGELERILIPFILENVTNQDIWTNGYLVHLQTGPFKDRENDGVTLLRMDTYPAEPVVVIQYTATGEINGWQHLDITRDSYGQMCVYLNGTLYIQAIDNTITESTLFGFAGIEGYGIDNITVTNNLITIDKAPPIWTTGNPSDVSIELNEPLRVELNVTDTSGIDSYWLNDTTNFAIDSEGVITNATSLDIGTYGIQVSVNDTNGYTLSSSFSVNVLEPEVVPIPIELIFIGIVGIVAVIAIVVVIKLKQS